MSIVSKAQTCAIGPNAIGDGTKRRIRTQTMYHINGYISGTWMGKRIQAANTDAAIAEAHAIGMRVVECTELKQKQK